MEVARVHQQKFCIITQKFCVFSPKLSSYSQTVCLHSRKFCVYFVFLSLRKIFVFFKKDYDYTMYYSYILGKKYFSHCFICKRIIKTMLNFWSLVIVLCLSVCLCCCCPYFRLRTKPLVEGISFFHISRKLLSALKNLILWLYACSGTILTKSGKIIIE